MSEIITVKIQGNRGNPPSLQTVVESTRMRLDKMDAKESAYYKGADPHFTYSGIIEYLPVANPQLLQNDDTVIDLINIDPLINTNRQFSIIDDPEPFPNGHWEVALVRYRGE
jgi:hypothetical protein